ncbi:BMP family ABC transporter substrate-binding protein [Pseudalkalibacillus caeni]|uniref:BMP family ABC transporter substrate-binding protein n=1 Tax=Exobacillus caeni TaxID=2574798 RepID=A0A5R9F607_9BACL|nr:BMP family ABC transporter substrate-binding protein [Pseudalkalibacillus caeni]TLS37820.1 BMP family ABC transporter substrate-binding protein [Pseudalkalibacillus caeni]
MKRLLHLLIIALLFLNGCSETAATKKLENVGLLFPATINDQVWNTKGYKGLLKIQSTMNVKGFYKENIKTEEETKAALEELRDNGVNLVFGHGNIYSDLFQKVKGDFPDMHFVSFNGEVKGDNMTGIHFKAESMGFFGGMVASEMTSTKKVAVIAAYPWQPEIEGFEKGVHYKHPEVQVETVYINDWEDKEKALSHTRQLIASGADIFYPAGDGFNIPVIEEVKRNGLYAIGFVSDQSDLGKETVLTSTVQNVVNLYELIAEQYNRGELKEGNLYFDFKDGILSMGTFSPVVPASIKQEVENEISSYIKTGKLPN